MIYSYKELKDKGLDGYNINKKVKNKELYKIDKGVYSDTKDYNRLEYVVKKYHNVIFTNESAFFYLGLTDSIPSKYFVASAHNSKKITKDSIKQLFMSNSLFEIEKSQIVYNGVKINIYNRERMLIELVRNRNKISFDLYKEIINNYRDIEEKINMKLLTEYIKNFSNKRKIFEVISREVF